MEPDLDSRLKNLEEQADEFERLVKVCKEAGNEELAKTLIQKGLELKKQTDQLLGEYVKRMFGL